MNLGIMGQTLTTATVNAADVIIPVPSKVLENPKIHVHKTFEGEPPPGCPMHKPSEQQQQPVKFSSECPIGMDPAEINPLNMVSFWITQQTCGTAF